MNCVMTDTCTECRAIFVCSGRCSLNFSSHLDGNCLDKREICQRQRAGAKPHPTPFGIKHILGLADVENPRKRESKKQSVPDGMNNHKNACFSLTLEWFQHVFCLKCPYVILISSYSTKLFFIKFASCPGKIISLHSNASALVRHFYMMYRQTRLIRYLRSA